MQLTEKQWRPVLNYEGLYEASSDGEIRRVGSPRPLKPSSNVRAGDKLHVCLSRNGKVRTFYVHVLVAEAFYGPKPDGMEVNHIDLDGHNNKLNNLEYLTHSDNQKHSVEAHGAWGNCGIKTLSPEEVEVIRQLYKENSNYEALSRTYGVSPATIKRAISGRDGKDYY